METEVFVGLQVCKLRGRYIYQPESALWLGLLSVITEILGASQVSGCVDDCWEFSGGLWVVKL